MIRRLALSLVAALCCGVLVAGTSLVIQQRLTASGGGGGGGGSTSDILFYANADSKTTGQSPQKGTGTITIGTSVSSATAIVSNGWDNNNAGNTAGRISISTTSNIDMSQGRAGFYMYPRESGAPAQGAPFYVSGATSTPKLYWQNVSGSNTFSYKDKQIGFTYTTNTWQFIEFAWDSSETHLGRPCEVFIDGVSAGQCPTGSAGADPSGSSVRLGGVDANALSMIYDQVLISTDSTRNLYLVRNQTSF